jgi:hypothetical protein
MKTSHLFKRHMGILNRKSVNKRVAEFEYAVRGAQAIRAEELRKASRFNVANSDRSTFSSLQTDSQL